MRTLFKNPKHSAGDTVVEVLFAIVLIGSSIALATAMSRHNLNIGVDSTQRARALSVSQGQFERIRNAHNSNNVLLLEIYKQTPGPFCILDDGRAELVSDPESECIDFKDSSYDVSIVYDQADRAFNLETSWQTNVSGEAQSKLSLVYKLPEVVAVGGNEAAAGNNGPPGNPGDSGDDPDPDNDGQTNPPTVSEAKAANINEKSAVLKGKVKPNGIKLSSCYFSYGQTPAADSSQANCSQDFKDWSDSKQHDVDVKIKNLQKKTTYYFKLCAGSNGGSNCTNVGQFKTKN